MAWLRQQDMLGFYLNTTKLTIVLFCCSYGDEHQNNFLLCAKQFVSTMHSLLYFWYDIPLQNNMHTNIAIKTPCLYLPSEDDVTTGGAMHSGTSNHCIGAWKVVSNSNVYYIQGDIHSWFTAVRNRYTLCWNCNSASVYHFASKYNVWDYLLIFPSIKRILHMLLVFHSTFSYQSNKTNIRKDVTQASKTFILHFWTCKEKLSYLMT